MGLSCFMGAIRRVAAQRKTRLNGLTVAAEITLHHGDDGEFSLSAVLRTKLSGIDQNTADELSAAAHQICPYSKATRGNIPVVIDATAVA
jgi:lipoyl-dependent peroxiredoxin